MWIIQPSELFSIKPAQAVIEFASCNKQDDGTVTFSYPDGSVLSVQENGDWQRRPIGTNGPFEKFTLNGNVAVVYPGKSYCYLTFEIKNA